MKRINAPARIAFLTVFSVAFLFVFVFPTRSYLSQRSQVNRAQHDLAILREQNKTLATEASRLHTNAEIERIARERYNMARPGEWLFNIVPTSPSTTVNPSTSTTMTPVTPTTAKQTATSSSTPASPTAANATTPTTKP